MPPVSKVKNRQLPCGLCHKFVFHIARHIQHRHRTDKEVETAVSRGPNSLELKKIINSGIFTHNVTVLRKGSGEFVVARRSDCKHVVEDFLLCKYCFLFFVKRDLAKHARSHCKMRPRSRDGGEIKESNMMGDGRLLLHGAVYGDSGIPDILSKQVLVRMRDDNLTKTVKSDNLITAFGMSLLTRLGPKRALDIAQRMRQVARLKLQLGVAKNNGDFNLSDVLTGGGFDEVLKAVEVECEAFVDTTGRRLFKNPAVALKMGHSILKLAQLKRGIAIRSSNSEAQKEADDFMSLHKSDFTDRISSPALASQRINGKKLQEYPSEADLIALKKYQLRTMLSLQEKLKKSSSPIIWRELAEVTLSRVIVFNSRRGSEVAEMTVQQYAGRSNQVDESVLANMSAQEQELIAR